MPKIKGNTIFVREDHAVIVIESKKYGRHEVLIDVDDIPLCIAHTWYAHYNASTDSFYACTMVRRNGKWTMLRLHELLMGKIGHKVQVDHVSRDTLDNRRSNLSLASNRRNQQNRRNNLDYIGVQPKGNRWETRIGAGYALYCMPRVSSERYAGYLYDIICERFGDVPANYVYLTMEEEGELLTELKKASLRPRVDHNAELLRYCVEYIEGIGTKSGHCGTNFEATTEPK